MQDNYDLCITVLSRPYYSSQAVTEDTTHKRNLCDWQL